GGPLAGAAGAHLGERAPAGGRHHPGGGARDGGVVVEGGEGEGFEDDAVGEAGFDDEDGGAGEVQLAFAVATNVAREPVGLEPVEGIGGDDVVAFERGEFGGTES